jgi:hypothetical protein
VQASHEEAKKQVELARQLSQDAADLLMMVLRSEKLPERQQWTFQRPWVRLLLWLLPEHIPVQQAQQDQRSVAGGQESSKHAAPEGTTVAGTQLTRGSAQPTGKALKSRAPSGPGAAGDWRQDLMLCYIKDVITVRLLLLLRVIVCTCMCSA